MKIIKSFLIVALLTTNLTSCTSLLWSNKRTYKETLRDFLVTKDGEKIVILGKKYHYILDDKSGLIKKILTWNGRSKLEMEINDFEVIDAANISGSVTIRSKVQNNSSTSLNGQERDFLEDELGFSRKHPDHNSTIFEKKISLTGERYLPKPGVNYDTQSHLNKEYQVHIGYTNSGNKAVKIALTPVAVAADGVLVITGVAMTVVLVPISVGALILVFTINGAVKDFESLRNRLNSN